MLKKQRLDKKKKKTIQRNRKRRHRESNPVYLHALRASNSSTQTRTQSLLCMRCDLWEGFSEFAVHQGKEGRKTRSDWQITEIFLHKSIISCKHQYFTFFVLFGFLCRYWLSSRSSFKPRLPSTCDLSIEKENNETMFTTGEARTISNANDTQVQQVAPNPRRGRFSTETPL